MTFLSPERLWLLLGAVALAVVYVVLQRHRRAYAVRFTNLALLDQVAPKRPGWRRHLPALLFLVALSTLVVGFAQPARKTRVPRERATICLAIDTSLSMEATDVTPSRIRAAKSEAKSFVNGLPDRINVGLVLFNGNASLVVSPTTDRAAAQAKVPVSTIAFGTDAGTITIPQEPVPIPVPVDHAALQDIAKTTGGHFYSATSESQLKGVYQNIGSSIGFITELQNISQWFTAIALVLLGIISILSLAWSQRLP